MTCKHMTSDQRCGLGVARGLNGGPIPLFVCNACAHYNGPARPGVATPAPVAAHPCGCGTFADWGGVVLIIRWLFIDWYGVPKPLRMSCVPWAYWGRGCGCMVRLKDWWNEVGRSQLFGIDPAPQGTNPTHVSAAP